MHRQIYIEIDPDSRFKISTWVLLTANMKSKSKAISVTGRGGLYGCETLRIPYCVAYRQGFQPHAPSALYSSDTFLFLSLVLISVRGWVGTDHIPKYLLYIQLGPRIEISIVL
jgi:hypothetical protein